MKYTAVIEKTGNGYSAYLLDLPGCIAAGDTLDETADLIRQAAAYHVEMMAEDGEAIPEPTSAIVGSGSANPRRIRRGRSRVRQMIGGLRLRASRSPPTGDLVRITGAQIPHLQVQRHIYRPSPRRGWFQTSPLLALERHRHLGGGFLVEGGHLTTVTEIQQTIVNLPKSEYAQLIRWLREYDWEEWEREFEEDVRAGRLDFLAAEALDAKRQGTLTEL